MLKIIKKMMAVLKISCFQSSNTADDDWCLGSFMNPLDYDEKDDIYTAQVTKGAERKKEKKRKEK